MKIFVVDDHPLELKLAATVLDAAGHVVHRADAAENALAAIRREHPDIILLDLSLPGMDGLSLARLLKADPATCDIPIVGVTSYPERFSRTEALAAGCDAFLPKPLSTRTLPVTLAELVASGAAESIDDTSDDPDR